MANGRVDHISKVSISEGSNYTVCYVLEISVPKVCFSHSFNLKLIRHAYSSGVHRKFLEQKRFVANAFRSGFSKY